MFKDFIKRFKPSYSLYNFFKKKDLIHNEVLYRRYGLPKKYFSPISSQDLVHLPADPNWLDKKDSREELPKNDFFQTLNRNHQESLLDWSKNGFTVLQEWISPDIVQQCNAEIQRMIDDKSANWKYANKIMFAIHQSELLRNIGMDDKLNGILSMLLGKPIDLFQSINFISASEQRTHSDSIHMSTFPAGNMIAVWIALEDMTMDNGLLHYYPGSHRLPYLMNVDYDNIGSKMMLGKKTYSDYEDAVESLINEKELEKQRFTAKAGDLLIWHANLLHGGEKVLNPNTTRKSMVFHFYAKDVICYHEITQRPTFRKTILSS
jgi:ectoine hydroxylase-related dioxygenase (phytanoyl-CoA dioxygenase family)